VEHLAFVGVGGPEDGGSSAWRPTSIMPTGSPCDIAQGTFIAGWPVTSKGAVFGIISRALAT
jgi:hypothetical protein